MVPHRAGDDLAAGRIKDADLAILLALLYFARSRDECDPTLGQIGQRTGKGPTAIREGLARLKAAGYLEFVADATRAAHRRIILLWRAEAPPADPGAAARLAGAPPSGNPRGQAPRKSGPSLDPGRDRRRVEIPEKAPTRSGSIPERQRAGPDQAPIVADPVLTVDRGRGDAGGLDPGQSDRLAKLAGAIREQTTAWLAGDDPILKAEALRRLTPPREAAPPPETTAELLSRLGEDPSYLPTAAQALASEFGDHKSWSGFLVALRGHPPDLLIDAYRQATGPKARNRGAVFMHALKSGDRLIDVDLAMPRIPRGVS